WSGHVAIATNSMSPGASGTITVLEENATCSGKDTVSWNGSMFGGKYALSALCWVHVLANKGGPACATGANWLGAGKYCWDQPGMARTASDTLYSCSDEGGVATAVQTCQAGCQHMRSGVDDQCYTLQSN